MSTPSKPKDTPGKDEKKDEVSVKKLAKQKRQALRDNARLKKYLANLKRIEAKSSKGSTKGESKEEKKEPEPKSKSSSSSSSSSSSTSFSSPTCPFFVEHDIKSSPGDVSHGWEFGVGVFDRPSATASLSLDFKHVADPSFVSSTMKWDPIVFLSFDIKMNAGRATSAEHVQYVQGLLMPLVTGPELPRDLRGMQINVTGVGDLVRITLMIPNPKTYRARAERLAREEESGGASGSSSSSISFKKKPVKKKLMDDVDTLMATASGMPMESDDAEMIDKDNPVEIMARTGIDFSTLVKRASLRIEIPRNFDTLAETKTELRWTDIIQFKSRFDLCFDPAIVKTTISGLLSVFGEPTASDMSEIATFYFTTFMKSTSLRIQLADGAELLNAIRMTKPIDDETAERDIRNNNKTDPLFFYLLSQPYWRILRLIADDENRSSYRFRDNMAILTVFKTAATVLSKDVDELSAIHVRVKTGQGISARLERVFPIRALADLIHRIKFTPPKPGSSGYY